ncbi:hypothetical protein TIFTF001_038824 [Ficus carica]|uniref:BED-type domain-containing protein n=1 Tax=Ficus carica TaxID=3494 RepID=A0AA88E8R6_FICCA|nr:hypothetical protein TIFTF001_038824 [Ficus carica]
MCWFLILDVPLPSALSPLAVDHALTSRLLQASETNLLSGLPNLPLPVYSLPSALAIYGLPSRASRGHALTSSKPATCLCLCLCRSELPIPNLPSPHYWTDRQTLRREDRLGENNRKVSEGFRVEAAFWIRIQFQFRHNLRSTRHFSPRSSTLNSEMKISLTPMDHVDLESQSENIDLEKASNVDIDLDEDVIELEGSDPNQPSKRKRLKSKFWEFFDVLPLGPDKKLKSACKKCGHQYLASSKYGTEYKLKLVEGANVTPPSSKKKDKVGIKTVDQDMNDVIQNVVNLNIDEEKTVDQDSNSGCA